MRKHILIILILALITVGGVINWSKKDESDEYADGEPAKFVMSIYLPGWYMIEIRDEKEIEDIMRIFAEHEYYQKREPLREDEIIYGGWSMDLRYSDGTVKHISFIRDMVIINGEVYIVGDELDKKLSEYIEGTIEYKRKQEKDKKKEEISK